MPERVREAGKWAAVFALITVGGVAMSYYANERTIDRRLEIARHESETALANVKAETIREAMREAEARIKAAQAEDAAKHAASLADREETKARQATNAARITDLEQAVAELRKTVASWEKMRENGDALIFLDPGFFQ